MQLREDTAPMKSGIEEEKLASLKAVFQEMIAKTISYTHDLLSGASTSSELDARTQKLVDATVQAIADTDITKLDQTTNTLPAIYPDGYVVIHDDLLCSISDLEHYEKRLILFISTMLRQNGVARKPKSNVFEIHAKDFALFCDSDIKNTYPRLESMAESFVRKTISIWDFNTDSVKEADIPLALDSDYVDGQGTLQIELSPTLVDLLCITDASQPHTAYDSKAIAQLSGHSLTLFELCAYCLSTGGDDKVFSVKYIREKFDCVDSYPNIAEFKRNVLDRSLKQINKDTPILVSYSQIKNKNQVKSFILSASGELVDNEQVDFLKSIYYQHKEPEDTLLANSFDGDVNASRELQDKIESITAPTNRKVSSYNAGKQNPNELPSLSLDEEFIQVERQLMSSDTKEYSYKVSATGAVTGINIGYSKLSDAKAAAKTNKIEDGYNYTYNDSDNTPAPALHAQPVDTGIPQGDMFDSEPSISEPSSSWDEWEDEEDVFFEQPFNEQEYLHSQPQLEIRQPPNTPDPEFDTPDLFDDMFSSKRERYTFAQKLAKMPELTYLARGDARDDVQVFAEQIMNELIDPEKQGFYKPYLDMLGFKSASSDDNDTSLF